MDTGVLEKLGFTPHEIRVYFALLEMGEATIGPISSKANVTPAKTYKILERLSQKGLITTSTRLNTKHFQAFNPERILNYLEDKKKEIEDQEIQVKKIMPQLRAKQGENPEQYACVYEGFNSIKALYDEILQELKGTGDDFIGFTIGEYSEPRAVRFFKNYDARRKELGIKVRLIGSEEQRRELEKTFPRKSYVKVKYVKQPVPTGVIVFGENVATLVWENDPTAFVIHSKQTAGAYKRFFEDMWKRAKL